MLDAHTIRALLISGSKRGARGIALIVPMAFAVWLAVGDRMNEQDGLIRAQTAEIATLNAKIEILSDKVRDQAEFDERLSRIESAVYGRALRDSADWRSSHCAWMRQEGLAVPDGMCENPSHEQSAQGPRKAL